MPCRNSLLPEEGRVRLQIQSSVLRKAEASKLMSEQAPDPGFPEEEVEQTSDPSKILPFAPPKLRKVLGEHYFEDPHLFEMQEVALEKHLVSGRQYISNLDDALRARFWYAYDLAAYNNKEMLVTDLCLGIIDRTIFYNQYIKNRFKMAWMVCKPTDLRFQDLALITAGKRKMSEVLRMEVIDPVTKKIDYKLIALQASIYRNLENRVFGLPTQKIEQKNLNLNAEISTAEMQKELEGKSPADLQKRLQDLKTAAMKLPEAAPSSAPKQITVEVKKNEP